MTATYTYATLAVSKATYEDVKARLIEATKHMVPPRSFKPDEDIDMHGIALVIDWGEEAGKTAAEGWATPNGKKVSKRKPRKLLKSEEWAAEVSKGQGAIAAIREMLDGKLDAEVTTLMAAFEALQGHKDDYAERYGNMPESLQGGENGERLQAIDEIDISSGEDSPMDSFREAIDAMSDALDECENADLPKN